jgi:mannose-6-phosphate isomerase-like protein (cupin superfamily)
MMRRALLLLAAASWCLPGAEPFFLRRQISQVKPQPDDLTANARGVEYRPLFGIGDAEAARLRSVARYGELTVGPGGESAIVSYPAEEQIYFVEAGSGTLLYGGEKTPVKANDFMYLPAGVKHGLANPSSAPLRVIVMGYNLPSGAAAQPPPKLMLANADDVPLQVLGQHGPTTQFRLLMGLTGSRRDKLSAARLMDSLFIMDFAPGGTNIPHNHPAEEEIYLLLRGSGEMVAGLDADRKEVRHPVTQGAAFYFAPGTQVGYYSRAKEGQEHDLILAVRSQIAMPRPPAALGDNCEPVNTGASPEARALLKRLCALSGKGILSGQHNYPNQRSRDTDKVFAIAGKYPAVWGSDFGFTDGEDQDSILHRDLMIQEAKKQAEAGSISFMRSTTCQHKLLGPAPRIEHRHLHPSCAGAPLPVRNGHGDRAGAVPE